MEADACRQLRLALGALERRVQELAVHTIAKRRPLGNDLRANMAAIRIAADIERIGDLLKNTARRTQAIAAAVPASLVAGLPGLGYLAESKLQSALEAFDGHGAELPLTVWRRDAELDAAYAVYFQALTKFMMEDPHRTELGTRLIFVAKNMERVGDHAAGIAEKLYYLIQERLLLEDWPKSDGTSIIPAAQSQVYKRSDPAARSAKMNRCPNVEMRGNVMLAVDVAKPGFEHVGRMFPREDAGGR